MKAALAFFCAALVVLGCSPLIPVYAPRRDNTEAHRQASSPEECLECHDVSKIRKHEPQSDCLRCHRLNEVY